MAKEVIVALDFESSVETFEFLNKFNETIFVKVGMELFYKEGPDIIKKIQGSGHKIFLDLKLHDIPTTVYRSMKNIAKLNVDMVTIHTLGGIEMMKHAMNGLNDSGVKQPLCVGVTILTSISQAVLKNELLVSENLSDAVIHYANNAKIAGLFGVVCSPLESSIIHTHLGKDFYTITPGIRLEENEHDDQVRVTTPKKAGILGSDYIVVGRTITRSNNPVETYQFVRNQFMSEGE